MITVPSAGKAVAKFPDGSTKEASLESWRFGNPMKIAIPPMDAQLAGVRAIEYTMNAGPVERTGRIPLIIPVPNSKIEIVQGREGRFDYFAVKNGAIEMRVAPKFKGALYLALRKFRARQESFKD